MTLQPLVHRLSRWMSRSIAPAAAALALGVAALPAQAGPYSSLVIFGDSLSDTGNLSVLTGGTVPGTSQPYFNGRFSDGLVWVETLAVGLGLGADAAPYVLGGKNYAFAGARTGTSSSPPGVLAQVAGIWGANPATMADPNALYVVVGGGNDMRDARTAFPGSTAADQAGRQAAAQTAASQLYQSLGLLAQRGARQVLVSNLPDLGATPEAMALGLQAASSDATMRFNAALLTIAAMAESQFGLDIEVLDMAGLSARIAVDATTNGGSFYGISSLLPCAGFQGSPGNACGASGFSDGLHPSALAHKLIGWQALSMVPTPGTAALVLLGLVALVAGRRRA